MQRKITKTRLTYHPQLTPHPKARGSQGSRGEWQVKLEGGTAAQVEKLRTALSAPTEGSLQFGTPRLGAISGHKLLWAHACWAVSCFSWAPLQLH